MSKILVIDDARSALQMIEMILVEAGHTVITCLDAVVGVKMLESETFDLIITDIYMPDHDGLEVIRDSRWICPNVPIVALSGMTGARDLLPIAKHLGACQTMTKPFSKADLLWAVHVAIEQRSSQGVEK